MAGLFLLLWDEMTLELTYQFSGSTITKMQPRTPTKIVLKAQNPCSTIAHPTLLI
jgi:hypothetical protein